MMKAGVVLFLLGLLTLSVTLPQANAAMGMQPCIESASMLDGENLLPYITHFWDADDAIKAPDLNSGHTIAERTQAYPFQPLENPGLRATLKHTLSNHWFRFCLHNTSDKTHELVAAFGPVSLSEFDFYPQTQGLTSFKTGNRKPMGTRDIPNPNFDFNIRIKPGETQNFYIRVNTRVNPSLHAQLWDSTSYANQNNRNESRWGVYVGVFLGLVIYNLLIFMSARQTTSLLFIIWSTCIFIMLSSLDGRLVQYFFPKSPHLSPVTTAIFYPLSIFLSAALFRNFIKIKHYPKWNRLGNALLIFGAFALLLAYSHSAIVYAKTLDAIAVTIALYFGLLLPIYTLIRYRLDVAKYIMFTLTPLIVVLVDRALFSLEITGEYYVPYKLDVAAVCAMIIISYYIGLIAFRERQAAQKQALEQLNISNTLKSNYNAQLEQELEQKTADIRLMNADLEQQAQKLVQLDESKSKFFANISHEFRTPLTLIEGPLNTLLENKEFNEKNIKGAIKHSRSLKGLIDQILLLSELDEDSLILKAARLNVVKAVREIAAQFESVFQQKGVELTLQSSEDVIHAYIDFEKLQVILNNLLSNAIKFTQSADHVSINISATAPSSEANESFTRDEYVHIEVSDTGLGIPEAEITHVFDRYFQSETSELSKSGVGTGIGLALVKELVELHAGRVEVESLCLPAEGSFQAEGSSGTTFRVTLPLGRAHLTDNEIVSEVIERSTQGGAFLTLTNVDRSRQEPNGAQSPPEIDHQRPTILVVDDNLDMRDHISQLLDADFNIITANDGLLAEAALKQQLPNLIITDLMMPNRNGLEFVQSIKQQDELANIPIIMLTARAGLHDRIKGLMAAVDDYLIKPFNGHELKTRIHNLLNKQAQFHAFYQATQTRSDAPTENKAKAPSDSYIGKIKATVNDRLNDPEFSVGELAQILHVSEATLRRRLSEQANFTPAAFIRHCRLEKARQLISQGHMRSVTELAQAVGFNHPTYFARLYEKTFNQKLELFVRPESPDA